MLLFFFFFFGKKEIVLRNKQSTKLQHTYETPQYPSMIGLQQNAEGS
jgi:hypothetical protein